MDAGYEDKIYNQIEKNLSKSINDKLYVPIEMIDKSSYSGRNNTAGSDAYSDDILKRDDLFDNKMIDNDNRKVNNDLAENNEHREERPVMSRAEYIRLAREACLRQLYTLESSSGLSNNYISNEEVHNSVFGKKKKDKIARLFQEGKDTETIPEEIASYKSLLIRTVCALVIFLSIFIMDKIKVKWGNFSYETIRHYVTGYNQLEKIEEIIISWLK